MRCNITSTGKASVEFEIKNVSGQETDEQKQLAIETAMQVFRTMKDKALNEYGQINNMLR